MISSNLHMEDHTQMIGIGLDIKVSYWLIQLAKILLLPPKYEIIMVPSNHSFFQYCDRNIRLFSIAPCKVITHPYLDSCRSFSLLKAIAIRLPLLFANAFKSVMSDNYCCRNSWKSDNYMGSYTEKKPWTNL